MAVSTISYPLIWSILECGVLDEQRACSFSYTSCTTARSCCKLVYADVSSGVATKWICNFDEVAAYWYILSYDVSIKCHRQTCSFNEVEANWYMQCSVKLLPKYQVMQLSQARWVIRQCSVSLFCSFGVSFRYWACLVLNLICAVQLWRCIFPFAKLTHV